MRYLLSFTILVFLLIAQNAPTRNITVETVITPETEEKLIVSHVRAEEPILIEPSRDILTDESPPEEIIARWCEYFDYSFEKAYYLAHCESRLNPLAENGVSSAKGLYQFLSSTWRTECEGNVLSAIHNSRCAIKLLSEGKENHWEADPRTFLCLSKFGVEL